MAFRLDAELQGTEIKDKWTEEDRKKAREELYTAEELKTMEQYRTE